MEKNHSHSLSLFDVPGSGNRRFRFGINGIVNSQIFLAVWKLQNVVLYLVCQRSLIGSTALVFHVSCFQFIGDHANRIISVKASVPTEVH